MTSLKIGIFGQLYHDNTETCFEILMDVINQSSNRIFIEESFLESLTALNDSYTRYASFKELEPDFDLLFAIGGDGTILKSVTYIRDLNIPLAGINTGRLGFLAGIQKAEIKNSVEKILNNKYVISERSLLQMVIEPEEIDLKPLNFALNEITVLRKDTTSMIKVEAFLNDDYLTSYWSDGLIVSTPTGSTGYSLSCGGPILDPRTSSFIITPIAAHNLNARPIVIPDSTTITLKVSGREDNYLVSLDSRIATLPNHCRIYIKKAPFQIQMIQSNEDSFIKTLRKKLLWGEDKRN